MSRRIETPIPDPSPAIVADVMNDEPAHIFTVEPDGVEPWTPPEAASEVASPEIDPALTKALDLNRDVESARSDYLLAAETAKELKKSYEAAQHRLSTYLTSLSKPMPLFDKPVDDAPINFDAWREIPLSTIEGITKPVLASMEEVGLTTLGHLGDWCRDNELTDLDGVGQAKAEKIEAALDVFWATHPELTAPEPILEPEGA